MTDERTVAADRRSRENSGYVGEKERNCGEINSGGCSADLVFKSFSFSKSAKINQNNWCGFRERNVLK